MVVAAIVKIYYCAESDPLYTLECGLLNWIFFRLLFVISASLKYHHRCNGST